MDKQQQLLTEWAKRLRKALIVSDVCDVLDEVTEYQKQKGKDEKTAINWAITFLTGVACGEQCALTNEVSFFILHYRTIVNMFANRHNYPNVY